MSMDFQCPVCGEALEADDELSGKKLQCPSCGRYVQVPVRQPPGPARPAPAPRPVASVAMPPAVTVVDITMPFTSLVFFLIKLALAAIPAGLILMAIYFLFFVLVVGGCASFFAGVFALP